MSLLDALTTALFVLWCASEILISLIAYRNQSQGSADRQDRLSYWAVWFSIVFPVGFAMLTRTYGVFADGFGSLAPLFPLLGYLGCLLIAAGTTIRLVAVLTLKKQFTVKVAIIEKHRVVDTGIYALIRHPAYLGLLMSLFGIGLILGNGVSLFLLTVLPLGAILYRIHVEEAALLRHFGSAYQFYADRTKRLLPGIW